MPQAFMLPKKPEPVDCSNVAVSAVLEDSFLPWMGGKCVGELFAKGYNREELLNDEITGLVSYLSLKPYEKQARDLLVSFMDNIVRTRWRGAGATAFGSTAAGLCLPSGDIDLVVSFHDMGAHPTEKQVRRRLLDIESEFKRAGITSYATRVLFARVPIISFTSSPALGSLKVDVSISLGDDAGRKAIPLVKSYLEEMPALRPLILCTKMFLSPRGLNNAAQGTLSSYAITLMAINFLQTNPAGLPVDSISHPGDRKSLGRLLVEFLKYYSTDFPMSTHYVSVSEMGIFPKENKHWKAQPTPMLSIECIINPDKDITRGATKIGAVLDAFRRANEALRSAPIVENESLLGRVIQIPRQLEASRNHLRVVMSNGSFHRATSGGHHVHQLYQATPSLLGRIGERDLRFDERERYHGGDYRRDYKDDQMQRSGYREIDQRSQHERYYRKRPYDQVDVRLPNVKGYVGLPPKPYNALDEVSGLPNRPPSFEYMRSMERRDNRGH